MPELAEVALFARDLNSVASSKPVTRVTFHNDKDWGNIIIPPNIRRALRTIQDQKIAFKSEGKALLLCDRKSETPLLEFRLAMTGQFHLKRNPNFKRHYFLGLHFENRSIYFADPRRFARVKTPSTSELILGGFNKSGFWKNSQLNIPDGYLKIPKVTWLLKHGEKTGVGNYMANEALGRLDISPFTPCKSRKQAVELLQECLNIAEESFAHGGNSFATGFFLLNGTEGQYLNQCQFYQNENLNRHIFRGRPIYSRFQPKK